MYVRLKTSSCAPLTTKSVCLRAGLPLRDKNTGEIVHHDKGKPGATGHEAHDHYHRPNPDSTGNRDKYLDAQGNPVPKGSEPSHLYPPEWVWWN